jgi:hypothetical protein
MDYYEGIRRLALASTVLSAINLIAVLFLIYIALR